MGFILVLLHRKRRQQLPKITNPQNVATQQTDSALSGWQERLRSHTRQASAKPAVFGTDFQSTYGDLEISVYSLSQQLRTIGIEPGDHVVVCLDRSPLTVAAFLAVLRVGGIYLPLDIAHSLARRIAILQRKPRAVITAASLKEKVPALSCPEILAHEESAHSGDNSGDEIALVSDDLPAYVMFTSGSTGDSQAVAISRGALASYADALNAALDIDAEDVYLHTASFSFSASIRQMIAPLTARASLVVADEEARHDPFRLLALMKRRGVTVWDTVPSLWGVVAQVLSKTARRDEEIALSDTVRLILLTGEPLSWELVTAWRSHLRDSVTIMNLYSQTETAGTVAMFTVPAGHIPTTGTVPLGEPLQGVTLVLLDAHGAPVPPGQDGEIHVASDRLALDCPSVEVPTQDGIPLESTARAEHRRIYPTGDFARLERDGSLTPVGRRDHRVKIRGYRIDLLEVERALANDPLIGQAVAVMDSRDKLVAYVVPSTAERPPVEGIRDRLRKLLPDYAVPRQITLVDHIPLLASGKVDRQALTAHRHPERHPPLEDAGTADPIETALLDIWESLLAYGGASPDDEFFASGGDSLTAVSLFLEIESHFGVRLPPSTLFTAGTVRELQKIIRSGMAAKQAPSVLTLREGGTLPPLFLVHAIWVHMPHFKNLLKFLDPELPVHALEPIRMHATGSAEFEVEQLVREYAREIRQIHPQGRFLLAGWSIGGLMAFSVAAELEAAGDAPAALMLIDSASPSLRPTMRQYEARKLVRLRGYLRRRILREIHALRLRPRQQWERLVWMYREQVRKLRSIRSGISSRERQLQLHAEFRHIVDQYRPRSFQGKVTLFRSEQDAVDPQQNDDLGWRSYVGSDLEIIRLRGDHNSMVIEPANMKALASHINEIVERASTEPTNSRSEAKREDPAPMDLFLVESRKLSGELFTERAPWNNSVTRDAIRHFADGICDDNPLWTDADYARETPDGRMPAPPAFLVSARYPILHGAPLDVPLISLLRDIEFTWAGQILEGQELRSTTRQSEVRDVVDRSGHRRIYIEGLTTYWGGEEQLLGRARSTVVRMLDQGDSEIDAWAPHHYSAAELREVTEAIANEVRTGARRLTAAEFSVGTRLPAIVRGPLTIGDMVCWHAAVGPSYRPGPLGYKDTVESPQFRVINPVTGWPIKYMLQHEDVNLAHQRGMPAPFDNGVMRFAWVSPLVTNWMGDHGMLVRLHVTIHLPVLYGDTCWYTGEVTETVNEGNYSRVGIQIRGTNQRGSMTTSGRAEVLLPL